jgi:hypothetical protein
LHLVSSCELLPFVIGFEPPNESAIPHVPPAHEKIEIASPVGALVSEVSMCGCCLHRLVFYRYHCARQEYVAHAMGDFAQQAVAIGGALSLDIALTAQGLFEVL